VTTRPGGDARPLALDRARLASELGVAGRTAAGPLAGPGLWREIWLAAGTGSTNADLLAEAAAGAAEGLVLAAGAQSAGRGRMGRQWISPPGAALTFSVLLRPRGVPPGRLGWLPLLAGVAVAAAVTDAAALDTRLKWPNDVLAGEAKLAGILAESGGGAIVAGAGINVFQRRDDLLPTATSLLLAAPGAAPAAGARERLLAAVLGHFERWYLAWRDQASPGDADACGLRREYLRRCATVGRQVTVTLPGGRSLAGQAAGIDPAGRLLVRTATGLVPVSAGDVMHVR
jgi:BirA family transcriptional regulator, biotin operon repressor / biotin---[acetyl-CoA-carboxylase] ligase